MGRTIAALALFVAVIIVAASASASAATSGGLAVGDVLKYDFSIQLQVHVAPAPHTTQAPVTLNSTVLGSEKITGLRSDPDGSVHASVDMIVSSAGAGQSQNTRRRLLVKVLPDGTMQPEGGEDPTLAQYLKTLGDTAKQYRHRTLHVGDSFSQTVSVPGIVPVKVTSLAKVVAQQSYRGYPTFAIQSTGTGKINDVIDGMPAAGTISVAGTAYFDQKDQLFIGEAVRSNVDATVAGAQGNRVTAIATINLILNSFTHAQKPKPGTAASPAKAVPSPTPAASPTSSPTPRPPNEYYTPTPPAPTPSPIVNPYPPSRR